MIRVRRLPFMIGRGAGCHLRPASKVVGDRHCVLFVRDLRLLLQDLGSSSGTLLNDRRLRGEAEVKDGDSITVGPLRFVLRLTTCPLSCLPTSADDTGTHATLTDETAVDFPIITPQPPPVPSLPPNAEQNTSASRPGKRRFYPAGG